MDDSPQCEPNVYVIESARKLNRRSTNVNAVHVYSKRYILFFILLLAERVLEIIVGTL